MDPAIAAQLANVPAHMRPMVMQQLMQQRQAQQQAQQRQPSFDQLNAQQQQVGLQGLP